MVEQQRNAGRIRSCDQNTDDSTDSIWFDLAIQDAHMSSALGTEEKGMKALTKKMQEQNQAHHRIFGQ